MLEGRGKEGSTSGIRCHIYLPWLVEEAERLVSLYGGVFVPGNRLGCRVASLLISNGPQCDSDLSR